MLDVVENDVVKDTKTGKLWKVLGWTESSGSNYSTLKIIDEDGVIRKLSHFAEKGNTRDLNRYEKVCASIARTSLSSLGKNINYHYDSDESSQLIQELVMMASEELKVDEDTVLDFTSIAASPTAKVLLKLVKRIN